MTAWAALTGSAAVWLLVLVVGTGAGYGTVLAWSRWGGRFDLPPRSARVLHGLLGVPRPAAVGARAQAAPPSPVIGPPVPAEDAESAPAAASPTPMTLAIQDDPTAPEGSPAVDATGDPGVVLIPVAPEGSQTEETSQTEDDERTPAAPVGRGADRSGAHTLSRSAALEELSVLFDLDYEEAVRLLDHGLWGCDNFEEWTRSMRGHARPADLDDATWTQILRSDWRELGPRVLEHREKRRVTGGLESLWGVGPDEAEALFAAGYKDIAALRKVSTDALAKVPGIGAAKAFQIRAAAHGLAPTQ